MHWKVSGMAKQRNWEKIKAEYITGNLSLRKTAEKFGISESTVCRRAEREHWYQEKLDSKHRVATKVVQEAEAKQVSIASKELELLDTIEGILDAALSDAKQFNRYIIQEHTGYGKTQTSEQLFEKIDMRAVKDVVQTLALIRKMREEYELKESPGVNSIHITFGNAEDSWCQ